MKRPTKRVSGKAPAAKPLITIEEELVRLKNRHLAGRKKADRDMERFLAALPSDVVRQINKDLPVLIMEARGKDPDEAALTFVIDEMVADYRYHHRYNTKDTASRKSLAKALDSIRMQLFWRTSPGEKHYNPRVHKFAELRGQVQEVGLRLVNRINRRALQRKLYENQQDLAKIDSTIALLVGFSFGMRTFQEWVDGKTDEDARREMMNLVTISPPAAPTNAPPGA